ncbi:hypothetical protein ABIC83_002384 [Roseateles asaccharophilus]|uniref:hypothetical protein n=1 Tax=Roseateles asaccharophilus TaxID=582607 RepID=UPI0038331C37
MPKKTSARPARLVYWTHDNITWYCSRKGDDMCSWGDTKKQAKERRLAYEVSSAATAAK